MNLFAAVYEGVGEATKLEESLTERDKNVLTGCLLTAVGVAVVGLVSVLRLKKSINKQKKRLARMSTRARDDDEQLNAEKVEDPLCVTVRHDTMDDPIEAISRL